MNKLNMESPSWELRSQHPYSTLIHDEPCRQEKKHTAAHPEKEHKGDPTLSRQFQTQDQIWSKQTPLKPMLSTLTCNCFLTTPNMSLESKAFSNHALLGDGGVTPAKPNFRVFVSLPRVRKKLSKSRCPVDLERDEAFHTGRKIKQFLVPQNTIADSNLVVWLHCRDH